MSDAFEQLVREYYQPLYRFGVSLSKSPADAADLTQQTYVIWAERGHQVRDRQKIKTWLFTTLYREYLRSRRRGDRFPHIELSEAEAELPTLAPDAVARMEAREVGDALEQVDEVFRAPLSLFYYGGHGYGEIAEILGVPPGTVMSRISRGKQQLRLLLAGLARERGQAARRATAIGSES